MALFTLRAAAEVRASQFDSANGDLDAEIIRQRTGDFDPSTPGKFEWPALLRKLDRIDPSYKQ
jgi:hypothetical protein